MTRKSNTVYRIGELAALTGTTPDTLRFYEREGVLAPPRRSDGGFRLYQQCAIDRLALVHRAQGVGLTLREIRQLISAEVSGKDRCRRVRSLLLAKLNETTDRIRELQTCQKALLGAIRDCDKWLTTTDGRLCPTVDRGRPSSPARRSRLRRYQR